MGVKCLLIFQEVTEMFLGYRVCICVYLGRHHGRFYVHNTIPFFVSCNLQSLVVVYIHTLWVPIP